MLSASQCSQLEPCGLRCYQVTPWHCFVLLNCDVPLIGFGHCEKELTCILPLTTFHSLRNKQPCVPSFPFDLLRSNGWLGATVDRHCGHSRSCLLPTWSISIFALLPAIDRASRDQSTTASRSTLAVDPSRLIYSPIRGNCAAGAAHSPWTILCDLFCLRCLAWLARIRAPSVKEQVLQLQRLHPTTELCRRWPHCYDPVSDKLHSCHNNSKPWCLLHSCNPLDPRDLSFSNPEPFEWTMQPSFVPADVQQQGELIWICNLGHAYP